MEIYIKSPLTYQVNKYQMHPLLPAWIDKNKFNKYNLTRHYRDGYNIKIRDASATQEVLITNY